MERLTKEMQIGPFAALKDKAEAKPGAFADYDCLYAHMMAVTRLKQYEDTGLTPEEITALISPPNPPLTLEELREMDREPVWVVRSGYTSRWYLVDVKWKARNIIYMIAAHGLELCAEFELANNAKIYRRKPEEGTP